jgi:hypothetical protein
MMLTSPRRRSHKLMKVEALETRDLLASVGVAPALAPVTTSAVVAPLPAVNPTVANVQFEPLTGRVLVTYSGDLAGYSSATLTNPANYSFNLIEPFTSQQNHGGSRPKAGVVLAPTYEVTGVTLSTPVAPGMPQTLVVSINNNQPLRDGIYEFTIQSAGITDLAGRTLDGAYSGVFPSGDGQPGSNFVAGFTETQHNVLPAMPAASQPSPAATTEVRPSHVFVPTVSAVRVGYTSATPGQFTLAGGNGITLYTLPRNVFPGSSRPRR